MYSETGQFSSMAADLERLISVTPGNEILYMQAACAKLYLGDETGYRVLCQRMFDRFGASTDARVRDRLSKTCLVGPTSLKDIGPVVGMARMNIDPQYLKRVSGGKELTPLFKLCAAMAEYRSGNFQACLDDINDIPVDGPGIEPRATIVLMGAMAHHGLKHDEQARDALARARPLFAAMSAPTADVIDSSSTIQDWLIAQVIRREAETLISGG